MHRVALGRVLALAAVLEIVIALVIAGASWLVGRQYGVAVWSVGVVVAVVVALVLACLDAFAARRAPAPSTGSGPGWGGAPYGPSPGWGRSRLPDGGGTSLAVAGAVLLLVAGVGGYALTLGFRSAFTRVAGLTQVGPPVQTGTEVLDAAGTATSGPLTLTVESVQRTRDYTRVELVARNRGPSALSMPVLRNCLLTAPGVPALEADPRSPWTGTVPGNGELRGVVYFPGRPASSAGTVSLTFTTVFGSLDARGVTVANLAVRPG